MIIVKCTQKFRNKHNQIIGYELMDQNGQTKQVRSDILKDVIRQGKIEVANLVLTSDNRLIDKNVNTNTDKAIKDEVTKDEVKPLKPEYLTRKIKKKICKNRTKSLEFKSGVNLDTIIPKANTLGFNTIKLTATSILLEDPHGKKILASSGRWTLPEDSSYLFANTAIEHINFRGVDAHNVENMDGMFCGYQAQSIDLSNLDTSNVVNMENMFYVCEAQSIDLSNFDTSNVTNMRYMFKNCQAQSLDLSSFDTHNVVNMEDMFGGCQAQSINLSSFDTSNVEYMVYIFEGCRAKIITSDPRILSEMNRR